MKRRYDSEYDDMYQAANGTYYIRYWSPSLGRVIEPSLKTKIRSKAVKERKRRLEAIGEEKDKTAVGYKKFSQVIKAFQAQIVWESVNTEKAANNQLNNHLLPYFGGFDPEAVTNESWRKYAMLRREKTPKCSLFNAQKYLSKVINWAFENRIIKKKFVPDDFDKGRKSPGVVVTEVQFKAIYGHLNQDWKDIALMAWEMAFRVNEIKKLEWSRVNFNTGQILLEAEHTKTRRARAPVMTGSIREMLMRRSKSMVSRWVFPGKPVTEPFSYSDQAWQLAKSKAKVICRFHDLRHTWLSTMFKKTNRYAEICEYAGLSLDEALKTYVKFTVDDMSDISRIAGEAWGTFQNV